MNPENSVSRPFLTIITPTRNAANMLQRCLKSVAAQNFDNWEHWIIDSVSTDETVHIARLAAEKDARVHVLSEADSGVYCAMNKGIRLARGEWIYFLGADDELFDPEVLSRMFFQGELDCDFLYGDVMLVPNDAVYGGPFDIVKLLTKNISHQAVFYRRAIFDRLGYYDLRFPVYADWAFNIKCMLDPVIRTHYVEIIVARFQRGGISRNGMTLDPEWYDERMKLFGWRFNLDQPDREILRSIVEELNRQTEVADTAMYWRGRYSNLLRVHNDLINSYISRILLALTWPARSVLLMLRRIRKGF